jgi:hypothetical protein
MGIVYLIYFEKLSYVGSTVQSLNRRMSNHINLYKRWEEDKNHYCSSFEIIQHDGYEVMVIEEVAKETNDDLRCRERFWVEWYGIANLVNKSRPQVTREEQVEQHKKYHAANRDERNRKAREYNAANREEIKLKKREYYVANRDEIIRKERERYAARKAKTEL